MLIVMTNIQNIMIPGFAFVRYLPTANNRKLRKNNREVESILRGIVGKRVRAMKRGESSEDDLLGVLLETTSTRDDADDDGNNNSQSTAGMGLTIQDVIEECKLFYFAGMETTSVLLTWTMVVLSAHPEWQDRAREEVLGLFGRDKPEHHGLSRLKTVSTYFLHDHSDYLFFFLHYVLCMQNDE
jgi:cytochrome P450